MHDPDLLPCPNGSKALFSLVSHQSPKIRSGLIPHDWESLDVDERDEGLTQRKSEDLSSSKKESPLYLVCMLGSESLLSSLPQRSLP
jgi:hypothetical protein